LQCSADRTAGALEHGILDGSFQSGQAPQRRASSARWDNGQIVEENLFDDFYDLVTFMRQLGLSG
jgi:hypothetical protein